MSHRKLEAALGLEENELKGILDAKQPRTPSVTKAKKIADALGLEFYVGPRRPVSLSTSQVDPVFASDGQEFEQVPLYSAQLAAGDGASNEAPQVIDHLAFRRDWLKSIGVSPQSAVIARAHGDSMIPTLQPGDALLIDRARADPPAKVRAPGDTRPAQIYALVDDGHARVKRLELASPGTLILLSDNPAHAPEFRQVGSVSIIGRVMWWGHTNRE